MISEQEARLALADAESVSRHSREVYGYSLSAPYCFIWGIAWFIGYMGEALLAPPYCWWLWIATLLIGGLACLLVGRSQERDGARSVRRIWLLFVVIYAFSFSLFAVFAPISPLQMAAYWPLLWAGIYGGLGLWLGVRYLVTGAVLAALTLLCLFQFREHFYAVMAFAGGGALILTGAWLRRS